MLDNMSHIPAQLFLGSSVITKQKALRYVQKLFCLHGSCNSCTTCMLIINEQYHAVRWFRPEKQWYAIHELEDIFHTTAFMLDQHQQFIFIIEAADKLSSAAANTLLKIVEEPPAGYQFIFLATRRDMILPTILSRCLIHTIAGNEQSEPAIVDFCQLFTTKMVCMPMVFDTTYEKVITAFPDPLPLLDTIFGYWMDRYTQATLDNDQHAGDQAQLMIKELCYAYQHLPMPGSTKLFWRTLLLKLIKHK